MASKRGLCIAVIGFAVQVGVVGTATAQDPTKVEPKHYKQDFENERVQVVSVHYGPHEKSGLHEHPGGVVVVITGGHLKFTDEKGKVTEVFAKPGEARWFNPFKHTVENVGDSSYNAVYVGIKSKSNVISQNGELLSAEELQRILADALQPEKSSPLGREDRVFPPGIADQ
jgi:quercetin dioxygenase-like cupin family protein